MVTDGHDAVHAHTSTMGYMVTIKQHIIRACRSELLHSKGLHGGIILRGVWLGLGSLDAELEAR
jgi:hypothetical protein